MKRVPAKKEKIPVKDKSRNHNFFEDVWDVAKQIPKGRVTSYGAIASYLGTKMSARMVGWAMNGSFDKSVKIPAHRVVNRNGMLSGKMHFETPTKMQELLEKEGTIIESDIIVDFDKRFWDPATELSL